ncbi:MAG: hypothetical protein H6711_34145 [Myxococcales bacterium]|nr:hypothetical protein [Myxococcales bacterium]
MSSNRLQPIADALQGRAQDGRLLLDGQAVDGLEIPDVLALLPGRSVEVSGVVIEVTDTLLTLAGTWTAPFALPALTDVAIKELSFSLKLAVVGADAPLQVSASLSGVLSTPAGAWAMSASAEGLTRWRIAVTTDTITFADVLASLPAIDIAASLPPSLHTLVQATRLASLALAFSPDRSAGPEIDVKVSNAASWELISGRLAVADTALHVAIALDVDGVPTVTGDIAGTVTVGSCACRFKASLEADAIASQIEALPDSSPLVLADAGALLGVADALAPAQDALTELGVEGIRPLLIALDLRLSDGVITRANVALQFVLRGLSLEGRLYYPDFMVVGALAQGAQLDLRHALAAIAPDANDILALVPELALSQLEIKVKPSDRTFEYAAASAGTWELLPGRLALRETSQRFSIFRDASGEIAVEGKIDGTTLISGGDYHAAVVLSQDAAISAVLAPAPDTQPISLSGLGTLLGAEEALAPVSGTLDELGFAGVRLGRLALDVDFAGRTITDAEIAVELAFRGVALAGYLRYPDLRIGGGLAAGVAIDLRALVEKLGIEGADLPTLEIAELVFEAAPERKEVTLDARFSGEWGLAVGKTSVPLGGVELAFVAAEAGVTANIDGWVNIGGAVCAASLALPSLHFSLGLAPGSSLALTELVSRFLPGDITLPDGAPALVFSALDLKAQPREQTFTFNAATSDLWPLPFGKGLALGQLSLTMAVQREGDELLPSASLGGTLVVGGASLTSTLTLQREGGAIALAQGDALLSLTEALAGFVPGDVALPPELGGLDRLELRGLSGSFDFATKRYTLKGGSRLEGLTMGELSVALATGSVEITGTGATLETLTLRLDANVHQELVPALQIDAIAFELALKRVEGGGWAWHVGGSLVAGLFELPKQTLRADASNGELRFSIKSAEPLTWSLPGAPEALSLSFESLALTLRRGAEGQAASWSFECASGLQLAALPRVSGTFGLYYEAEKRGFEFSAAKDQGELGVTLPLVEGDDRFTLGCNFKLDKLSLLKTTEWTLSATSTVTWAVPQPKDEASEDPIDKALGLLGLVFARSTSATLAATSSGVTLSVTELPQVPIPLPIIVNQEVVWDRMGALGLARLDLRLAKSVSATGKLRMTLPEELSNVFGEENGRPKTRVFSPEWVIGIAVDDRAGLSLSVDSLPLNLEASNYFKEEKEGERTWQRFTLGDVCSFRYGAFADPNEPGITWTHLDLLELGEVRFQQPSFAFNGADFSAKVNVDVLRELRIPTAALRWLLVQCKMQDLADRLPKHVAPLDIHVLDPATKALDADRYVSALQSLASAMNTTLPEVEALRTSARAMADHFNQLPEEFRAYLDVTIPKKLDLAIAVTPATGFGVKFDISAPKEPLRALIPTPLYVYGFTIRKLSLGEILGGNLLLIAADLDADTFDTVALVASLALPPAVIGQLTDTTSIQRKVIIRNLLCLVVYQTGIPIPIPVWFDELGFKHHGLEGVRSQLVLGNNLAGVSVGKLFKGLGDLYRELRRFFTEEAYALPADLFGRSGINMGVHVKPGFVQLPKYLGSGLLGSEAELFNLGADSLLVPALNFLKKPEIGELLGVIPLELRDGSFGAEAPLSIGPIAADAAWLLTTTRELDALVHERASRRSGFIDALYREGAAAGDASVQALRETVSRATEGAEHDGLVAFVQGSLAIPNVDTSASVRAGMLAVPGKGLVGQYRVNGEIGRLLRLDLDGRVAVVRAQGDAVKAASADLSMAGGVQLSVLGYQVLAASFALKDGELAFASELSLFPPDSIFKVKAGVQGAIGRGRMRVDGEAEIALAPLPATRAALSLSYEHVELQLGWLDQEWVVRLEGKRAGQVVFSARATRPVEALPGLITLLDASDDAKGPSLELVGPSDPSATLTGRITVPALDLSAGGRLAVSTTRVESLAAGKIHGVSAAVAIRGEALDKPASFTYAAEFTGDLFTQVTELLHDGFVKVLDGARKLADDAERIFNEEWAKFRKLVERGANEIRAGLLETKARIEALIGDLEKAVDRVNAAIRVSDDEIAARKAFLKSLEEGAQKGLQWFKDRVAEVRGSLEGKRRELRDHDAWYEGLGDFDKFLNWGYYAARRLQLLIEGEALPGLLRLAEDELAKAQSNVTVIASKTDEVLQQLDRLRNGLADELSRHKEAIVARRRELSKYNDLLLSSADELIQRFGQAVDDAVMKAAKDSFDRTRAALDALEGASDNFRRVAQRPFEIQRLAVEGSIAAHAGHFRARADVVFNTFDVRKVAQNVGFDLDFADLPATALTLAKDLWDRRDALALVDYDEYERNRRQMLDQDYAAVIAERADLGPEFGETLDKKLLLDMQWSELAEFHHHLQRNAAHSAVLGDAAALTTVFHSVLERYREAAEARRTNIATLTLLKEAYPDLNLVLNDPAVRLEEKMRQLLEYLQTVLKNAAESNGGALSFGAEDERPRPFRLANLAEVRWDEVAGNEGRLIVGDDGPLSFESEADASEPRFRLPGAVLLKEPNYAGETMLIIHVGETSDVYQQVRSLVVLPGHRLKLHAEGTPADEWRTFTGCATLPGEGLKAQAVVERIDLTKELPPPQLAACAALSVKEEGALWSNGNPVRYAIAFEYADGTLLRSGWWSAIGWAAVDAEGYVKMFDVSCPMLSNISRDPTGKAVARRVYRQARGGPEVMVARIGNNIDTTWTEPVHACYKPPPPVFKFWAASLPLAGSPVWRPGFGVRYALEFEYADGGVARSEWWQAERRDGSGYSFHDYALPHMTLPPDPLGQAVARRVVRQFSGLPERIVARVTDNTVDAWTDTDPGTRDRPTPPPVFKFWAANLPVEGSPVWRPGMGVRYAIEFEYYDGAVVRSAWWQAERQVDGDGYSFHDYALPHMTLPVDPTDQVVARRVIRQFKGKPERTLARIANNTATEWTDPDRGSADEPPPPPALVFWAADLPVAGSLWQPGFGVRYAIEFEYADGSTLRSPWWQAERQDGEGYSFHAYAFPHMKIPRDLTGEAVARRLIRQFVGLPERILTRITDNAVAEWTDTDRGVVDRPLAPPDVNLWSASLPVASSPVWQPGARVRYAIEIEYSDGFVVRSGWWRAASADAEGYATATHALPQLRVPRDPNGLVAARRVIRQFEGRPERVVGHLADNTTTLWIDGDRGVADNLPPPPTLSAWSADLPAAGSPAWQPGVKVRYAVEYEYANATVLRGGWWRAEPHDEDGYASTGYAMPVLNVAPDSSGQVVARRIVRQFHGRPERIVARLTENAATTWHDVDPGVADMPPPPAPSVNCWASNLPVAGSPLWQPGFRVRYAIAFEYADGSVVRGAWWRTPEPQDAEGYTTASYAMPVLNIPAEPTGQAVARHMIRQVAGRPERTLARIANNTDAMWHDTDLGVADMPPPPAPTGNVWSANLPVAGSPVWQAGVKVRYAVAFEYADGSVVRGPWWRTPEPQDAEGYVSASYAMPVMNIPREPTDQAVARHVIRQFQGRPERVIARVANNIDPSFLDSDAGFADAPPPPTLNCWAKNLPLEGSPVWQPGVKVRYAVAYELADGSVARSPWLYEGFHLASYACAVLNLPIDPSGRVVARRIIRQFLGLPERVVARVANNIDPSFLDSDAGFGDAPPPPTLNCWAKNLPVEGSPVWQPGVKVRYAVAYELADGSVARSPWLYEGYHLASYACAVLNLPVDPSGHVVARRIIRQFLGLPERVVARVANNIDPSFLDSDAGFGDAPPPPTLNCWAKNLPVEGSPVWQPGVKVRYAVAYELADGSVARSPWLYEGYHLASYACAVLNLPVDPSGHVVARRIIRQFLGLPERVVARVANNSDPTFTDGDLGTDDVATESP